MDFLGAAPTANENQSNSFTPRVRQAFGELEWRDWSLTGGQAWSLLTLNKQGIETLGWYNPDTIDAQYVVGFTFARLMSMRLVKSFDNHKVTAAFAIENSAFEQAGKVPSGVIYGGTGSGSLGNSNTYTNSLAPDVIGKVAFDPSFGHFEVKAVGRFLRDRVEATSSLPSTETNTSNTTLAGGFGVDAYVPVLNKKLIPRRIVVVWPRHCPLRRFVQRGLHIQTEWHDCGSAEPPGIRRHRSVPDPEAQGLLLRRRRVHRPGELRQRLRLRHRHRCSNSSCFVKDSGSCSAEMRNLVQGAAGFWYDLHKGNYGTLKYGMQYSYTHKSTWADASGLAPTANENMAFTSLRYVLP